MAFSPDGQRLASGSHDQTVKIWDSATGKELFALKGHVSIVRGVAFSSDGQRLASANQDGSIHLWETSISPEIQHRRATSQMVADLFGQMPLRADVQERLRTLPGMSPSRRQEAIAVAQTFPENPHELNELAWQLVKLPGGEMSGYRNALRYSEEACQLEPANGDLLNTLGVAYYRIGNYQKALDVLVRSAKINSLRDKVSYTLDLPFLAMAHQQLGHAKEAGAELQLLRERMKDPRWRKTPRLRASCAMRKNCWHNPKRRAPSKRTDQIGARIFSRRASSRSRSSSLSLISSSRNARREAGSSRSMAVSKRALTRSGSIAIRGPPIEGLSLQ